MTILLTSPDFKYHSATPHPSRWGQSLQNTVAGCGSPTARGAKPHSARYAAFSILSTSYGGSNGRAQALPVTLRVPRSSTPVRAAAQCGSWSAVVHLAQLETNMIGSTTPRASAQILTHVNFDRPRVIQTRRAGRLPKAIPNLWQYAQNRRYAAFSAIERNKELSVIQSAIACAQKVEYGLRYEMAALMQRQVADSNTGGCHG